MGPRLHVPGELFVELLVLITVEQIVAVPVPQIQGRTVEVFRGIPQERVQQHTSRQRRLTSP